MIEKELYRDLGTLTKRKEIWKESIVQVGALLDGQSPKIIAKALWLLGEMGRKYPVSIVPYVEKIASFLDSPDDLLCERAVRTKGDRLNLPFLQSHVCPKRAKMTCP